MTNSASFCCSRYFVTGLSTAMTNSASFCCISSDQFSSVYCRDLPRSGFSGLTSDSHTKMTSKYIHIKHRTLRILKYWTVHSKIHQKPAHALKHQAIRFIKYDLERLKDC